MFFCLIQDDKHIYQNLTAARSSDAAASSENRQNRPNSARFSKRDSQAKESQTEQKDDYEYEEAVSENELNNDNQNQTDENENENDEDEYEDDDDEEEILIPAGWKVGLSKCKRKFFYNDYNKDKVLVYSFFLLAF